MASNPVPSPVQPADRIFSLDALRGVAVLGILIMNIQSFSEIGAAYMNPSADGRITGVDYWIWFISHILADQKFMAIFSMLFGAGIVLFTSRAEARGRKPFPLFRRRSLWLLVFGLLHAYLLWSGDILVAYAICGLAVYKARHWQPRTQLVVGLVLLAVTSGLLAGEGWSLKYWPSEAMTGMRQALWEPTSQQKAVEIAAYRGGWVGQMSTRAQDSFGSELQEFIFFTFWRVTGLMLAGMALFKWRVLTAQRSRAFYRNAFVLGLLFGIPLIIYGTQRDLAAHWSFTYSFFFGIQFNYWGSLGVALSWICLVMLLCQAPESKRLLVPLANTGRMAFSVYILETLLGTSIFYGGHGAGLFEKIDRPGQLLAVLAIWAIVIAFSQFWLHRFTMGPLEWLWRTLTYRHRIPLRKSSRPPLRDSSPSSAGVF
ncbi:MAG: DUF418 domain-containing protein [Acidobacteriota bacterium]|nr:DUF418 domain-containing protein [Acidobacteriota bacterium]